MADEFSYREKQEHALAAAGNISNGSLILTMDRHAQRVVGKEDREQRDHRTRWIDSP